MKLSKAVTAAAALAAVFVVTGEADAAKRHVVRKSTEAETIGEAMHTARIERGYVCYSDHWHYGAGSGDNRKAAERAAVSSWSSFVDLEYGSAWAIFAKAGSKKMSCSQGSGKWECSVEARPCRS